jgi:acetyl esterase/lipase
MTTADDITILDGEEILDPELAALLRELPMWSMDFGTTPLAEVPALRAAQAAVARPPVPPTTTVYEDRTIPGPAGDPDVVVRVFHPPTPGTGRPAVCFIHGGGYLFGSALVEDARLNRWVEQADCVVVSVEYRLSPETAYPGPLEDCYAALTWMAGNAAELGIDAGRITIAGQSAGGGLAAGLALLARDRREVAPAYQLLIYPMIDDRNVTASTHIKGAKVWSREANLLGWTAYLGREPGADDVPIYAAAARATDLAGLPPTFIAVGSADVFRDEDIDYATRLLAAGVPTELHVYPGACHGFEGIVPNAAVSKRCQRDIDDAVLRALR